MNRGKRSLCLDLEGSNGGAAMRRLIRNADVFVQDLGLPETRRLGLTYEELDAPRLIYAAISGFGEQGPLADCESSELVAQAMADCAGSLGSLAQPPIRLGADVGHTNTAVFTGEAILAALLERERSGYGQRVSTDMLGSLLHLRGNMWASMGDPDDWYGFHLDTYVKPEEYGYQTATRPINFSLGRGNSEQWDQLLIRLDMLDAMGDERFADFGREAAGIGRYAHEVKDLWEQAFATMSAEDVIELIHECGGNAVPLNDYESLLSHPQITELRMIEAVPQADGSELRMAGVPAKLSDTPCAIQGRAPKLGEHSREVLIEAGFETAEVERLIEAGVVTCTA
ncbi:MAG: CoA transferase [Chloroflexi bacterium]|nr:CoA transferase [Chloroflexota bacterium]